MSSQDSDDMRQERHEQSMRDYHEDQMALYHDERRRRHQRRYLRHLLLARRRRAARARQFARRMAELRRRILEEGGFDIFDSGLHFLAFSLTFVLVSPTQLYSNHFTTQLDDLFAGAQGYSSVND